MLKIYQSTNGQHYLFHLAVDGREKKIEFRGDRREYKTDSVAEQSAIEKTTLFLTGKIAEVDATRRVVKRAVAGAPKPPAKKGSKAPIVESAEPGAAGGSPETGVQPETEAPENPEADTVEYPDVADINGAVAALRGEPYKVHHTKLKTPAAVREQAALNKVAFPNWAAG